MVAVVVVAAANDDSWAEIRHGQWVVQSLLAVYVDCCSAEAAGERDEEDAVKATCAAAQDIPVALRALAAFADYCLPIRVLERI